MLGAAALVLSANGLRMSHDREDALDHALPIMRERLCLPVLTPGHEPSSCCFCVLMQRIDSVHEGLRELARMFSMLGATVAKLGV